MQRMFLAICVMPIALSGCASLQIEDSDSVGVKLTKGLLRVPVAVLTIGMSEGYYATERTMKSWLGHQESSLLLSWGPPSQIYSDGSGGKFVVYSQNRAYVSPGYSTTNTTGSATGQVLGDNVYVHGQAQSQTTYVPPQVHQWTTYRMFQINSEGTVVAYSWKGL